MLTNKVTIKKTDSPAAFLKKGDAKSVCKGRLSRGRQSRKEDGEALAIARRVALTKDLDDLREGEPMGNLDALEETTTKFSTTDVEDAHSSGDLVFFTIVLELLDVNNHAIDENLDSNGVFVCKEKLLGGVWVIEGFSFAVVSGASMITSDDKVGATIVLANDGVPAGLTGTGHAHCEWEQTQCCHSRRVILHQLLVASNTSVVIDVSGLCHSNDGMDKNVSLFLMVFCVESSSPSSSRVSSSVG